MDRLHKGFLFPYDLILFILPCHDLITRPLNPSSHGNKVVVRLDHHCLVWDPKSALKILLKLEMVANIWFLLCS